MFLCWPLVIWLSLDFIGVTGIRRFGLTWIFLVQQASGGQPWAGQWISCGRLRAAGCAPGDIEGRRFGAGDRVYPVYSKYIMSVWGQWSSGWTIELVLGVGSTQLEATGYAQPCSLLRMSLYRFLCFLSLSYNIRTIKRISVVVIFKFWDIKECPLSGHIKIYNAFMVVWGIFISCCTQLWLC